MELSKFVGFMFSEWGIIANLEKVEAIVGMPPPPLANFMKCKGLSRE